MFGILAYALSGLCILEGVACYVCTGSALSLLAAVGVGLLYLWSSEAIKKGHLNSIDDALKTAEAKNKQYEQEVLLKDQEITSLNHRMTELGAELDKTEAKVANLKTASEGPRTTSDNLTRKVALLEEELDATEEIIKEITEKLRQVDVKAEHFERQVQRIEQECDVWKKKYEAATAQYKEAQRKLDEITTFSQDL